MMDRRDRVAVSGRWYDRLDERRMVALIDRDHLYEDDLGFTLGEEVHLDGRLCQVETIHSDGEEADVCDVDTGAIERVSCFAEGLLRNGEVLADRDSPDEGKVFIAVPIHFQVCPTCDGKGSHVNPSIDAHGITAEEWDRDWDHDEWETYLSGGYDVPCYECEGRRVVPAPVLERCSARAKLAIEAMEERQRGRLEDERTMRRECGEYD